VARPVKRRSARDLITAANSLIGAIHGRLRVLLDHEGTKAWLSGKAGIGLH